jgi:hypothetical protein
VERRSCYSLSIAWLWLLMIDNRWYRPRHLRSTRVYEPFRDTNAKTLCSAPVTILRALLRPCSRVTDSSAMREMQTMSILQGGMGMPERQNVDQVLRFPSLMPVSHRHAMCSPTIYATYAKSKQPRSAGGKRRDPDASCSES